MRDDGGPAFPAEVDSTQPLGRQTGNTTWQTYGMTLRDYFAAHAPNAPFFWRGGGDSIADLIDWRYYYADAMLKARKK